MFSNWEWFGEGWWHRTDLQSGWVQWRRVGGFTPGEGGHRSRPPRAEGTILQMDLPCTANRLFRLAACPHTAYVAFQQELKDELGVKLRTSSGMYVGGSEIKHTENRYAPTYFIEQEAGNAAA